MAGHGVVENAGLKLVAPSEGTAFAALASLAGQPRRLSLRELVRRLSLRELY